MLKVHEIYHSIQGESSYAGLPCTFIRLTYCNLRCTYCDTEHAFYDGTDMEIPEVLSRVASYGSSLVEVTGGEPLVQTASKELLRELCNLGYSVLLETGGSLSLEGIDPRVVIIMDLKCPSSGMAHKNDFGNIPLLKKNDEIKFVIGNWEDFCWAKETIERYQLHNVCGLLFSAVYPTLQPKQLVEWVLQEKLRVRFQLQLHKYIWPWDQKGV